MENKFTEVMTRRSDAELIKIITISREDYVPEALLAAKKELDARMLTEAQFQSALKDIKTEQLFYKNYSNADIGSSFGDIAASLGEFFDFDIF